MAKHGDDTSVVTNDNSDDDVVLDEINEAHVEREYLEQRHRR